MLTFRETSRKILDIYVSAAVLKNLMRAFVHLSVRLSVRLSPGITVGMSIVCIFQNFNLIFIDYFCCLPHISIPPVVPFFTHARFFPEMNSYVYTIRLHMHDYYFSSTECQCMYNKTNYSKIDIQWLPLADRLKYYSCIPIRYFGMVSVGIFLVFS